MARSYARPTSDQRRAETVSSSPESDVRYEPSGSAREPIPGEILQARVDRHGCDDLAGTELTSQLDGGRDVQSARRPDQQTFLARELLRHRSRVALINAPRLVVRPIGHVRRHAAGADPFDAV